MPTVTQAHDYKHRGYNNHYHSHNHHYNDHRRSNGAAIGLGIAGAIIGLGIAAETSRRYYRNNCFYETVRDRDGYGVSVYRQVLVCD